jgi:hypothetical protein
MHIIHRAVGDSCLKLILCFELNLVQIKNFVLLNFHKMIFINNKPLFTIRGFVAEKQIICPEFRILNLQIRRNNFA